MSGFVVGAGMVTCSPTTSDGVCSGVGNWTAYLAFVEHPAVEPHLRPFDLGSSEDEARHWLLLDREARTLSALSVEAAAALLQQQSGIRQASLPLQWETLDAIPELLADITGKRGWRAISIEMVPVPQPGPEQVSRLAELRAWLDQQEAQYHHTRADSFNEGHPQEEAMTPDPTPTTTTPDDDKDALLRQMAILLQVARKEWPQQTEGTQWDCEVQAVLQRYRALPR